MTLPGQVVTWAPARLTPLHFHRILMQRTLLQQALFPRTVPFAATVLVRVIVSLASFAAVNLASARAQVPVLDEGRAMLQIVADARNTSPDEAKVIQDAAH